MSPRARAGFWVLMTLSLLLITGAWLVQMKGLVLDAHEEVLAGYQNVSEIGEGVAEGTEASRARLSEQFQEAQKYLAEKAAEAEALKAQQEQEAAAKTLITEEFVKELEAFEEDEYAEEESRAEEE